MDQRGGLDSCSVVHLYYSIPSAINVCQTLLNGIWLVQESDISCKFIQNSG